MKFNCSLFRICPLCNSRKGVLFKKLLPHYSFNNQERLLWCLSCKLISISPFPNNKQIKSLYSNNDYVKSYEKLNIKWTGGKEKTPNYLKKRLSKIESLIGGKGKILDIGSGSGSFLNYARSRGWQAKGIEVSQEWVKYAKKNFGIKLFYGELKKANFASNSFDLVHLNHVFEHLNNPIKLIKEVKRILKPGGYLLIEVPQEIFSLSELIQFNLDNNVILKLLTRKLLIRKRAVPQLPPSFHLFFFTAKSLKKIVTDSDLKEISIETRRRNKLTDKTIYRSERLAKLIYKLEEKFNLGPNIILTASKPV